ncbi:retrovirus-related pol polyprotein from transposon TNT 1-94 [Tanacetum coccineum]
MLHLAVPPWWGVTLKEKIKSISGNVKTDKVKMDMDEIETLNIELDHRVSKLIAENEHLKQTYKQLYDSIKPARVRSKEQCDGLINQVNQKSVQISDLNAKLQEQGLVITALKNELRKLKGKALDDNVIMTCSTDPAMLKIDMEPITLRLLNKRTAHSTYIKHTQDEAAVLRDLVEHVKVNYPQDAALESAFSLNNKNCVVELNESANVQHSKLNVNSESIYVTYNDSMLSDKCVNARVTSKSVMKNITTTTEKPPRKQIKLEAETHKPAVTLVYSRKPRKTKSTDPVSKPKIIKSANIKEPSKSWGSTVSSVPSSSLNDCRLSKLFSVKFGNDHVAKIMGYGDYQIGNVTISRVYYVEGLGHNLFSIGQFCDSNLEVAFRQHTCFIRNLESVDLLTGSRGDNLYTLLSHLNFGAINHLARHGLVRGLPKIKFEKDHLCSACVMGKSKKKTHKPKSEDTNQEKLYLLHMDLCGPMRVARINGKKYILVIVDDYSWFTWVKCLRSKDEASDFIIKFLKMIQVRLKTPVRRIRTDNQSEFVNQTLREYYEKVDISHETYVARSPQNYGVIERRNRTLIEAARTMLIYAKSPLFLWTEAVATACYTQNRSMIRLRHDKTPYELLHNKTPDLSFLHVFGALCYPTNDSENLGKLQPKADIGIFIGYAPTKKAFQIYNRRTKRIIETIHVDFDELTTMASEHSSSEPALHEITPATISSGLIPNPPPSTSFVPPSRSDWDILFQPLFDELQTPPPNVDLPAPEVIAPIVEVVAPEPADSTGSPSSTTVDQDAPFNLLH